MIETNTSRHAFRPMYVIFVLLGLGVLMSIFPLFRPSDIEKAPLVPDPSDVVDVIVDEKPLTVPDEFRRNLQGMGIASIVLVDSQARLRAYTIDGAPINLCGPRSKGGVGEQRCKLEITSQELVFSLSGADDGCAYCNTGALTQRCHLTGNNANKWPCRKHPDKYLDPDTGKPIHYGCPATNPCGR
jgi:hypothetical protein